MDAKAHFLIVAAIMVATAVAPTLAVDYMVGDNDGWKTGVDYTVWAKDKNFHVGDTIMFMYKAGDHNVQKVNVTDFKQCTSTNSSIPPLTTGNDVITLAAPGKKWYISTVGEDCKNGMKLSITVSPGEAPAPAPFPWPGTHVPTPAGSSSAVQLSPLKSLAWLFGAIAAYKMIFTAAA